jgi:hypothetical protein
LSQGGSSMQSGLVSRSSLSETLPIFGPIATCPTCGVIVRATGQWTWISQALGFKVTWVWSPYGWAARLVVNRFSSGIFFDRGLPPTASGHRFV